MSKYSGYHWGLYVCIIAHCKEKYVWDSGYIFCYGILTEVI